MEKIVLENREYSAEEILNLLPQTFNINILDGRAQALLNIFPFGHKWCVEYSSVYHQYSISCIEETLLLAAKKMVEKLNNYND